MVILQIDYGLKILRQKGRYLKYAFYLYQYEYIYIYILYIYIHIYTHVNIYIYTHLHIMYMYIYIYTHIDWYFGMGQNPKRHVLWKWSSIQQLLRGSPNGFDPCPHSVPSYKATWSQWPFQPKSKVPAIIHVWYIYLQNWVIYGVSM